MRGKESGGEEVLSKEEKGYIYIYNGVRKGYITGWGCALGGEGARLLKDSRGRVAGGGAPYPAGPPGPAGSHEAVPALGPGRRRRRRRPLAWPCRPWSSGNASPSAGTPRALHPPPHPPPPNTHTPAYQSIGCFVHALQPPPIYTPHFIRPLESDMLCTPPFHTRPASPIICLHQRPRRVHRRRGGMKNTLQALRRCPDENSS